MAEAEAAGMVWKAKRGIWVNSKFKKSKGLALEDYLMAKYAPEALESMPIAELRAAVEYLTSLWPDAARSPIAREEGGDLRTSLTEQITQMNACIVTATHQLHKKKGANEGNQVCFLEPCWQCKKLPPAGKKIKRCDGCFIAGYCSRECQVSHWKAHKKKCRVVQMHNKEQAALGKDPNAAVVSRKNLCTWYQQVPNLATDTLALAWAHRHLHPILKVTGGKNTRIAQMEVLTQSFCKKISPDGNLLQLFREGYDKDVTYVIWIVKEDCDGKTLDSTCFRAKYPYPPSEMGAVAKSIEDSRGGRGVESLSSLAVRR